MAQLAIGTDAAGQADAHGVVVLRPAFYRGRPLVLIAQGATAACADTDGDGVSGLIRVIARFVDVESGDEVIGILTPSDGVDITDFGEATLELVGKALRAEVDGEVRWRRRIERTRF